IRESLLDKQIKTQVDRGIDLTLFSPRAAAMGQHIGDEAMSMHWSRVCNDLIHRVCTIFPEHFAPVCQLPQSPGCRPENVIPELRRCVEEMGFVGCNLNPDPAGGYWTDPPMTDEWWFPVYEVLEELDLPAMIHVSGSCNPNFQYSGAHYINGDTSVFMQILDSDLFERFPKLKIIIPHGGGAVPFHWGRYRGLAMDRNRKEPAQMMGKNMFFDTCVYHQPGINLMTEVVPVDNVLFASETFGAVRAIDPETGHQFDDTKRYIENSPHLSDGDRQKIFAGNAQRVFSRLNVAG
ncbi:MAG: amidohydrolase family protein, partial [Celeribacter sp.]